MYQGPWLVTSSIDPLPFPLLSTIDRYQKRLNRSDEGLTSAFLLFTVANLRFNWVVNTKLSRSTAAENLPPGISFLLPFFIPSLATSKS